MFLCDEARFSVLEDVNGTLQKQWDALIDESKAFRWPDKPVLFDRLETYFWERGCRSPIMYINTSPGLMRVKRAAGLASLKHGATGSDPYAR